MTTDDIRSTLPDELSDRTGMRTLPGEDDAIDPLLRKDPSDATVDGAPHHSPASRRQAATSHQEARNDRVPQETRDAQGDRLRRTIRDEIVRCLRAEVDPQAGSVDDDASFLALGIDSVGATEIAMRLGETSGLRLTPDLLYEHRTIRELSAFLARRSTDAEGTPPAAGAPRRGAAFLRDLAARNKTAETLKARGEYFYDTPFSHIDGNSGTLDERRMVDEAHSLGVIGRTGGGVQEHFDLPPDAIDLKMGTLSKALGSQGGFVAGTKEVIGFLKHNSRGFVFSTSTPAPTIAAALKGLEILRREPERVARLQQIAARFLAEVRRLGFSTTATETPIVPLLCGTEEKTLRMTAGCRKRGLFVVPIFYPVVPMNSPRIRITLIATLTDDDLDQSLQILGEVGREVGVLNE